MDPQGLPDLHDWVLPGEDGYHLQGYMAANVGVAEAVALADLYWPEFVEYRGGAFLAFKFDEEGVDRWFDHLTGDVTGVEAVVNHFHLWDHFILTSPPEYAALPALAEKIAAIWRAAVAQALPHRQCEVRVSNTESDYGPTVTLTTTRSPGP
jgi:hypothetical protein